MNTESLKYADETDKCYGLAGMAIGLMVWDAEGLLESINLDAPAEEALRLAPSFYLAQTQRTTAKAAWEQALHRFRITAAITVANVTCRAIVHHRLSAISSDQDAALRIFLATEGTDLCQLDPDETLSIYHQSLSHCHRIFRHPAVNSIASSLASKIINRRVITAYEVFEVLAPLSRL